MNYNYVKKHGTLKTTPPVAAGLTEKPWTVAEMIERTAAYKPEPFKQNWPSFLSTMPSE